MSATAPSTIWIADIDTTDFPHNHIKKIAELTQAGFPIAPGFVVTDHAYFQFLKENNLDHKIKQMLSTIAIERPDSLMQGEAHVAKFFAEATLSDQLIDELLEFYDKLNSDLKLELHATGKHQAKHFEATVYTDKEFIAAVKEAWAMMFSSQALWHRHHHELDHLETGAYIMVQAVLPQEKAGKAFTVEKKTHAKDKITIIHGHDHYVLSKKNITILDRELKYHTIDPKLTHNELLEIADLAKRLEQYLYFSQEISWTYIDDMVVLTDTKPINTLSETPSSKHTKLAHARGTRISPRIGTGHIKIIQKESDLASVSHQHIVVLPEIKTKHFTKLKQVKGIITESGHPHTEIATLLRKHGVPAVFNVKNAMKQFRNGNLVTIHGNKAEIYRGGL